jgi:hypothetical protein
MEGDAPLTMRALTNLCVHEDGFASVAVLHVVRGEEVEIKADFALLDG